MMLPSGVGGATTTTVGYFQDNAEPFAAWLREGLGDAWTVTEPRWTGMEDALLALRPSRVLSRYACIRVPGWTLVLNNTPLGTDVGVLPMHAARELGIRAVRATSVERNDSVYPGRILAVYDPEAESPLRCLRTIAAANDGGRWVFETSGRPFGFEDVDAYRRRLKRDRFTGTMLHAYLAELGIRSDCEPDWATAIVVERTRV